MLNKSLSRKLILLVTGLSATCLGSTKCLAQQDPGNFASRVEEAEATAQSSVPERYNILIGSGGLYFSAAARGIYVDNVYLAHDDRRHDFIVAPQLNIGAYMPIGQLNALSADVGVAYYHYIKNHNLNTETPIVNPNSELKFRIYSGDFRFTLSEKFSYEETPFFESGGQFFNVFNTGRFARYLNRAGGDVRWDLHHLVFNAGYHHEDLFANGSTFNYINRHSEIFNLSADMSVAPKATVGVESAGSLNRFEHKHESDHWRGSVGPSARLLLTDYLTARLGAGYTRVEYNSSAASALGLEGFNTYYAYGELTHQWNELISDTLRVSHDNEVGINAANLEGTHAIYSLDWNATEALRVSPYLGYHHFEESYGPGAVGLYRESFDYYSPGVSMTYVLGQNWRVNVRYDYRRKDSEVSTFGYTQNRVSLMVTYQF